MEGASKDTTGGRSRPAADGRGPVRVLAAYDAIVALATSAAGARASAPELDLAGETARMRAEFERRTGAFGPEDAWFEARSRAFWDDALTTQGFAALAGPHAGADAAAVSATFGRAHRGVFLVESADDRGAHLVDLWSGAELLVRHLDDEQRIALEHAEGAIDARVVAGPEADGAPELFVLPGAFHHPPDALPPMREVMAAARERALPDGDVLDALMRMERVLRSSSRVKPSFAYRVESLPRKPAS